MDIGGRDMKFYLSYDKAVWGDEKCNYQFTFNMCFIYLFTMIEDWNITFYKIHIILC